MRKHSVRKWLHAVLDLLPVLILPVFAIYEINHDHNEPISVEISQNQIIDFNQRINNGDFADGTTGWSAYGGSLSVADNLATFVVSNSQLSSYDKAIGRTINFTSSHKYLIKGYISGFSVNTSKINVYCNLLGGFVYPSINITNNAWYDISCIGTATSTNSATLYFGVIANSSSFNTSGDYIQFQDLQMFDLTQMFGVGNEPSIEQFNTYFTDTYYDYVLSDKYLLKDVSTITYSDTDVGSQMIYSLYKPVVNYFNFNNVFNFGAIYDWFQLNMFNGNAPMVAFIVWNIIVYEFIMDILFLVYSVFMFLIDFAEGTLEKFTGWCTRG